MADITDHSALQKRPLSPNLEEPREKRPALSTLPSFIGGQHQETVFRILCPIERSGSIIGKSGSVIKAIRSETKARIKIADVLPGATERVVIIASMESALQEWSAAQEGLLRIHACISENPPELVTSSGAGSQASQVVARLLVPNSQVGCLLGKGGSIVTRMREESGSQIKITPAGQIYSATLPSDELVQISGDATAVNKALEMISTQLRQNPPKDVPAMHRRESHNLNHSGGLSGGFTAGMSGGMSGGLPGSFSGGLPGNYQGGLSGLSGAFPGGVSNGLSGGFSGGLPSGHTSTFNYPPPPSTPPPPVWQRLDTPTFLDHRLQGSPLMPYTQTPPPAGIEITFRILAPSEKIGLLIGRSGTVIKHLRDLSGARIKVEEAVEDSPERVIAVSATETGGASQAPSPAQTAVFLIQDVLLDRVGPTVDTVRLLVPNSQVGCLLGKKGSIIGEMRRSTGANIRIMAQEERPKCALETDELVQIVGNRESVKQALAQVTDRLRAKPHHESTSHMSAQFSDSVHNQITTINVTIAAQSVGPVLGKGGVNIKSIRSLSGARVKLHDPEVGNTNRTVEIAGTMDQVNSAQMLLQSAIASNGASLT